VPTLALSSPGISASTAYAGSADLNLTSERYSRSSLERANELRGEEDVARGRENRWRKRDTAEADGISPSCVMRSAGGRVRLKGEVRETART
jgi:hypothetical protein